MDAIIYVLSNKNANDEKKLNIPLKSVKAYRL